MCNLIKYFRLFSSHYGKTHRAEYLSLFQGLNGSNGSICIYFVDMNFRILNNYVPDDNNQIYECSIKKYSFLKVQEC